MNMPIDKNKSSLINLINDLFDISVNGIAGNIFN